jgi:methylmalonyl-CoA/ethylmalonyl-CoA epimerase
VSASIDHVALVVRRIEPVLDRLDARAGEPCPIEEFPGEGTRECYLGGGDRAARLLLMEPLGEEGPYARALARRGPGLHHVGLTVPELAAFPARAPGWLVHPACLPEAHRCLWMARPGVGTLLEVVEGAAPGEPVIEKVEVPCPEVFTPRLVAGILRSPDAGAWLTLGGERLAVAALIGD